MESSNKVTIVVTQEDIDQGIAKDASRCPLSIALARTFGEPMFAALTLFGNEHVVSRLPQIATNFIYAYDAKEHVEPFSFEVDKPWPYPLNRTLTV